MATKRFLFASLAAIIFTALFEFLFHSVGLMRLYAQTAFLWRTASEIRSLAWLMWLSYAVYGPVFVYIYTRGYEDGKPGLGQGTRYGFWIGLFLSVPMALNCYAVMPIPPALAAVWFAGGMAESILTGALVGLIWKK